MAIRKDGLIRAVVVDDSPTARELIVSLLQHAEGITVVGSGASGEDAVRLASRLHPDVMTLDVRMEGMDGLEATRRIMRESPLPIILVTSSLSAEDTDLTFRALKAGALTVARKPGLADPDTCASLVQMVRTMAGLPVVHHWGRHSATRKANISTPAAPTAPALSQLAARLQVVGIAASTGGPNTLAAILSALPADNPWPVLLVQHVTPGFGLSMMQWLDGQTKLRVRMAEHGEPLQPGVALFAPDDYHMQVSARKEIELIKSPPYKGLRPSANPLFRSLAAVFGSSALGVILTGMGDDGVDGLEALHKAGGFTIAQTEATCVVYGMPRAAVEEGLIDHSMSPDEIAQLLAGFAQPRGIEARSE